ncbi:hypothetical protein ACP5PY_03385 [Photobacterium leiognathi subsp. mandapamensis]
MNKSIIFDNNNGPVSIEQEKKVRRSSVLGKLIEIIATSFENEQSLDRDPSEIEKKIDHNCLDAYRYLVDSYIENSLLVDSSMTQLNSDIMNGSLKLKRQMNTFYKDSLVKFRISTRPVDIEKLRVNSDFIIQDIIKKATTFVNSSSNLGDGYYDEDITWGIQLVVSYSIIECIVLENPNDYN